MLRLVMGKRVWNHRNLVAHSLPTVRLEDVFEWASGCIEVYQNSAAPLNTSSSGNGQFSPPRWSPPIPAKYLLNFDVAIDGSRGVVGFGLAIRNSDGCVMAVSSQQVLASYSPMVAEAVAIFKGIQQLACDTGLVPLDLVSDAAVVVGLVNDTKEHASEIGLVIDAIRRHMMSLPSCVLRFAPRATNFVAHTLAKKALVADEDCVWIEDFSHYVRKFLIADAPGCV
ncbi:hypothetical protein QYF36_017550 [Acer negundo]|nr:hypothetical protein QYF36_017550 [Acer negundo]